MMQTSAIDSPSPPSEPEAKRPHLGDKDAQQDPQDPAALLSSANLMILEALPSRHFFEHFPKGPAMVFQVIIRGDYCYLKERSVFASLAALDVDALHVCMNKDQDLELIAHISNCVTLRTGDALGILREYMSGKLKADTSVPEDAHQTGEEVRRVTTKAWKAPYAGDYAKHFASSLHDMNSERERKEYDNVVSIIQSSGMGKSRLVHEVAKLIFTLPFNLRDEDDISAYPEPDSKVRKFLLDNTHDLVSDDLELRYLYFLRQLFHKVKGKVMELQGQTYEQLVIEWQEKMDDATFRKDLYSEVVDEVYSLQTTPSQDIDQAKDEAHRGLRDLVAAIRGKSGSEITSQQGSAGSRKVFMLLTFDESHVLLAKRTATRRVQGDESRYPYHVLCRSFNSLLLHDVIAVFLSTNSNLSTYAPQQSSFWSNRGDIGKIDAARLQAPYVELPFDVFANVEEGRVTVDQVSKPSYMVQFGRPLWYTRWHAADRGPDGMLSPIWTEFFHFAKQKILALRLPELLGDDVGRSGQLAVLSIRILLEFETRQEDARKKEAEQVAGHMRICYSVPSHRKYMYSGTPSEPILAEAAARIMHSDLANAISVLEEHLENGLISKGERGEVIARLLLTLAHDAAIPNPSLAPAVDTSIYSQPISVLDFLGKLISSKYQETVLESLPAGNSVGARAKLGEVFKNAKLNFTHFVKAGDSSIICDKAAWKGLARGMAYVCANNQAVVDLIIPILLWDAPLSTFVVSAIFFQFKNRKSEHFVDVMDADELRFFTPAKHGQKYPAGDPDTRPYITVVMQLGVDEGQGTSKGKEKQTSYTVLTGPVPTRTSPRGENKKSSHHRYALTIIGCSDTVYGVLESGSIPTTKLAKMLMVRDLLSEHPRQKCRRDVMLLKPKWYHEPGPNWDSFHWARQPADHKVEEPEEKNAEGVLAGEEAEASKQSEEDENRMDTGL